MYEREREREREREKLPFKRKILPHTQLLRWPNWFNGPSKSSTSKGKTT